MADLKIDLQNATNEYIYEALRKRIHVYSTNPLWTWRWWSGFIWGAVFMPLLNIGDVHLCVGECDGNGVTLLDSMKGGDK